MGDRRKVVSLWWWSLAVCNVGVWREAVISQSSNVS
jgi:hypothetical protein